jgi:hypothetical protein
MVPLYWEGVRGQRNTEGTMILGRNDIAERAERGIRTEERA